MGKIREAASGAHMIPTSARTKFKFQVTPSDRQLWAIGMVVVQWTVIEEYIKIFVHAFTDENNANDPIRQVFDSTRSLQLRLDQWEELSRQHIQAEWLSRMLKLINEIRQLADQRDKIVHGVWSDKQNSDQIGTEAHGPFSWGKPGHPFSWKLSYGDILGVALKMDQLQGAMFEFAFLASAVPHGDQFTFGSALRRIQNVQDRA